jgi:protocatechuate 3,4-dioxygenase beta subunit
MDSMELERRNVLRLLGGAGLVTIVGACGSSGGGEAASSTTSTTADTSTTSTTAASTATVTAIPAETGGPYPGDGSNGPNILEEPDVVRSDITKSIGDDSGTASGVPLTITLKVLDLAKSAAPLAGAAIYLWHADSNGEYSMYSLPTENYLRGVQETASDGTLTFQSIFPGCDDGRWPHIHFTVYESLAAATGGGKKLRTSQIALPEDVCEAVYASSGYSQSTSNLSRVSLESDNVFRDGWSAELATVTGSVAKGYTATLNVGI